MIQLKRSILGAAVCCALISTSAQAAFSSFWFDPDGAGVAASAYRVDEFFDISGRFLAQNTYTGATSYTFNQWGTANITGSDSLGLQGDAATQAQTMAVAAKFYGSGTGDLSTLSVSFTGGFMEFYNPAYSTMFAKFAIIGGTAVTAAGLPNGFSTLVGKALDISSGYFFRDVGGLMGADLVCSGVTCDDQEIYNIATTNVSVITSQATRDAVDGLLSTAYSGEALVLGADGLQTTDGFGRPTQFYASANGQDRFQIPEPGSIALLGLGLVGLAALRRRSIK